MTVQRYLYAKHPVIEQRITEFVEFAREQRLPVSKTLIQERARMIARNLGLESFKASNGWFSRYLRRSNVQSSCNLHGKGNESIQTNHLDRIEEIRSIAAQYQLKNIWNMD